MSKTSVKTTVEWKNINWRKAERLTFKLQKRIFQASERGDVKAVRKLQKTLIRSWSAKAMAVRRVTQDNQGKKTAGVDGVKNRTYAKTLYIASSDLGDRYNCSSDIATARLRQRLNNKIIITHIKTH